MSSETEDRTQAPSKRNRQQAKEQGQAAQSPELTAAAGLLAASVVLALWGDRLFLTLLSLVRDSLCNPPPVALAGDPVQVVSTLRSASLALIAPLGATLAAFSIAAFATHQGQVRGLWVPALLAPDPSRLWTIGSGQRWVSRGGRGVWSLAKAAILLTVAFLVLRFDWRWFQLLGRVDPPALARAVGQASSYLLLILAAATLVLGLIDFAIQFQHVESLLRLSPEQHREDMRAVEGDPALRGRRRRLARSLRFDSHEILAGASLILTDPSGLSVVLAGGPPPRAVSIRSIVTGPSSQRLCKLAEQFQVPEISAPALTRRLAQLRPPHLSPTGEMGAQIRLIWPLPRRQV
jgi:flagellar biosynthesis protein FlhB